jgi:hypothetical protein
MIDHLFSRAGVPYEYQSIDGGTNASALWGIDDTVVCMAAGREREKIIVELHKAGLDRD